MPPAILLEVSTRPSLTALDTPAERTFALLSAIVATTILLSLMTFFGKPSRVRYRIALFFITFALSTVSLLLFYANAEIRLDTTVLVVSMVGTGIVWVAVLALIVWLLPEDRLVEAGAAPIPPSLAEVVKLARDIEARSGWQLYSAWKAGLGQIRRLFEGAAEEYTINELLSSVFHRANERKKPNRIQTELIGFYFDGAPGESRRFIKLCHVEGDRESGPCQIYHTASQSLPGGTVSSIIFELDRGVVKNCYMVGAGGVSWHDIPGSHVEYITLAYHPDSNPPEGDYFVYDVPKYTALATRVQFCLASTTELRVGEHEGTDLWEVKPSPLSITPEHSSELPMVFRKLRSQPTVGVKNARQLGERASQHLQALRNFFTKRAAEAPTATEVVFLKQVFDAFDSIPDLNGGFLKKFPQFYAFDEHDMQNALVATYRWR